MMRKRKNKKSTLKNDLKGENMTLKNDLKKMTLKVIFSDVLILYDEGEEEAEEKMTLKMTFKVIFSEV